MALLIILIEVLAGFLLGRAIAYVLTRMPASWLRRFITLLLLVLCCGVITVAWYLGEADLRHIVYAAALAALIGFVLSQRTDRAVRLATCCIAVPTFILASLSYVFFVCEQLGVVDLRFFDLRYPIQTALLATAPVAFVLSVVWYVPVLLWRTRDGAILGTRRAVVMAGIGCFGLALLTTTHDALLRRRITTLVEETAQRERELYGAPPTDDQNAVFAYQSVIDAFDPTIDELQVLLAGAGSLDKNHDVLDKYRPILDGIKNAAAHPGRFCLTNDMIDRHDEIGNALSTLALGLIARAKTLLDTDPAAAVEDLKAARGIQRHLASDPRASLFRYSPLLELRLRPVLERLDDLELPAFYSQVPFEDLDARTEYQQQQFLTHLLEQHYLPTSSSSLLERTDRFARRLLWAADDIRCVSNLDPNNVHMNVSISAPTIQTLSSGSDRDAAVDFHELAAVNDVGSFAKQFYLRENHPPTIGDLPDELRRLLGKDAAEVVAITPLDHGCVVSLLGKDDDLVRALVEADAAWTSSQRSGAPSAATSEALSKFGVLRAGRVFLVGEALRRYRAMPSTIAGQKRENVIILLAPDNVQTFALLSAIGRGEFSNALIEIRRSMDREDQHEVHDAHGSLGSVLKELCQLDDKDGFWSFESYSLVSSEASKSDHRLIFWSLEDMSIREQLLSEVRKDAFDDAFEQVHWDFGTPHDEQSAHGTWNELSKLADFIESAFADSKPILCITAEQR